MTKTCEKGIEKAIKSTIKLINEFHKDSDKCFKNEKMLKLSDEIIQASYIYKFKLNKKYKLEINIVPIGLSTCELTYYILDEKDIAIDQYTHGPVWFEQQYIEMAKEGLEYLIGMYC